MSRIGRALGLRAASSGAARPTTDFICPACEHLWSLQENKDGLFNGYGSPPCPECGTNGGDASDYGDFRCASGHEFRSYGNGGLVLGCWPNCPTCGQLAESGSPW